MRFSALNDRSLAPGCDFAMIRGGHICGDRQYADDSFFSLEDLEVLLLLLRALLLLQRSADTMLSSIC